MTRWKGSVASLVPDSVWRQLIDLGGRASKTTNLPLQEIKRTEFERFRDAASAANVSAQAAESGIYVKPEDFVEIRQDLEAQDVLFFPLDRTSISPNVISGWVAASRELVMKRRDLAEAFGVRVLVTAEGVAPSQANVLDFTQPVDLVYTWVDGNDDDWLASRNSFLDSRDGISLPTSAAAARFESNDELRYSLRSVEAFMPWVNHIYIVTAGHSPDWLMQGHDKLTVVSHDEIFHNPGDLPSFNSHAIESQLHHIDGLSEHFLYMNDDFFVGRKISKNAFYTPHGVSLFSTSHRNYELDIVNRLPINVAAGNNAELIKKEFGLSATLKFKHVAHPQRKSVLETIERKHPELVARTSAAKFRSSTDLSIPSSLAHYYGAALGSAASTDITYQYIDMGASNAQLKLAKLCWGSRPQMFCLNQVSGTNEELIRQGKSIKHFLEYAFPWKSSFEI